MPKTPGRSRNRRGARTAFSAVMRALSDYALTTVPTDSDQYAAAREWIVIARRVRAMTQEVGFRAVVLALESGASWHEIAAAFGYRDDEGYPDEIAIRAIYEDAYAEWRAGVTQPWTPPGCQPVAPDADTDPDVLIPDLDAWYARRTGTAVGLVSARLA